jgi:VCBS repeat-containing protein
MPNTAPPYTIGGITRPELFFDANGNVVLTPAAEQFAATYGLKLLYIGLPANTPYPPVADSLSAPTDSNAAANSVAEGAAVNTPVNLTVSATSSGGNTVTYSLVGDTSGGGFKIDPTTGVVTVADPTKIDFETSPGHAYSVTAQANDGIITTSQTFTINVTDVAPSAPVDSNAAANSVAEGAAVNTLVGITASSADVNGPAVTYSLVGDTSGGGFKIDPVTGVVSVADPTKVDYESSPGHAYTITAQASDGTLSSTQTFTIAVTDVTPSTPVDVNAAANNVAEGAANGSTVGVTASSADVNGPAVTYSLVGDTSGGGFTINSSTGVVTVADSTKIDYESAAGHAYSVTVQASDGTLVNTQTFVIAVSDVAPSTPTDTNAAANTVAEGAAAGTTVGVTASSIDVNGPAVTYSLVGDSSGGGFTINSATGVVTVADPTKIDYESSPGHAYSVTAQASDGTLTSSQTFTIAVTDVAPSTPVDSNAAANSVVEGAAVNTLVGITASSADVNGPAVTYSLVGDTSGGGFKIDPVTGAVSVADPTKIDYESSPGHAYTITAQASDGTLSSTQTFTIAVTDVTPSTPVDVNAAANNVAEGAANGSTVGVTASSADVNGPAVTYSLVGDTSGGGFTINSSTGVVTVADSTKIDYESAAGHAYSVTVQASDGTLVNTQTFAIAVSDVAPSTPTDANAAANTVAEGAAAGTTVGVTASSIDVNGPAVTYSLVGDSSGGGFTINSATGVVSVADPTKIDYESSPGHAYSVTAQASDGTLTSSQSFSIAVTDVAPSTPVDSDAAANSVVEGAAVNTLVGITASSTDVNGPAVTWSLTGDTSGGGFKIDPVTGVVSVADSTKIDYESSPGHAYGVTAQASDGTLTSSQTFTIGVIDVPLGSPVDTDATPNCVAEGAAANTLVGITAFGIDPNGPATAYSLIGDTSGGGFTINSATGVVTVADPTKIDYETAPGHAYSITVQANDGLQTTSQTFTIAVSDVAPSTPADSDPTANSVAEGAAAGTTVGVTASSNDINGPAVTYSLVGDTSGGGFTINATTGVVTVADPTKIDYESAAGHAYTVTAQASDGTLMSAQSFSIAMTDVAPSTPVDSDATTNTVAEGAAFGTTVGITASSTDINGPAVTWSLTGDTSGGGFTIDPATGIVTVVDPTKIDYETSPGYAYSVTAQASDGTLSSSQTFSIAVSDVAPTQPIDSDPTANAVFEGAAVGTTVGVTASSTDVNGPAVTYSLAGDTSNGGFTIDPTTGVVTVADPSKIDFESATGHAYTITTQASDGTLTSAQTFNVVAVIDVAPSTPIDSDATANTVAEGAAAGTTVGVTASSTDVNGPLVTYSLTADTSNGGFVIDPTTGVITVADPTKIDFETSPGHAYSVTAQATDGTLSSSQSFTIAVSDVAPGNWTDTDAGANTVVEDAANGTTIGITANAVDPNGGTVVHYSLVTGGTAPTGAFAIDPLSGVITVANGALVDYESAPGHAYTIEVQGADDNGLSTTQAFTVDVTDLAPSSPQNDNGPGDGSVLEGAAAGTAVGIVAQSTDPAGGTVTYSLSNDAGGLFTIDPDGTVRVSVAGATGIDYESTASAGHKYVITVDASDGTLSSSQNFTIDVTDAAPSQPTDSDGVAGGSIQANAADGTAVGITLASTDPNGGAVTYSLTGDTSNGAFAVDPNTGVVTLVAGHPALVPATTYIITAVASDGTTQSVAQNFNIFVANNALNIDLDGNNSTAIGNSYAGSFTEQGTAAPISDTDDVITNTGNPGVTTATSATIVLTDAQIGDSLLVTGVLPAGISQATTTSAGEITITLTGSASYTAYQTALHQIQFSTAGDAPNTTPRILDVTVTDSTGTSPVAVSTISVIPVNDAPVLHLNGSSAPAYTENGAAAALLSAATITDPDNPTNFAGGSFTVAVTNNAVAGDEIVVLGSSPFTVNGSSLMLGSDVIGTVNNLGTSSVSVTGLTSFATPTVVNELAEAFGFQSSSDNPTNATRTLSFTFNDGGNVGGGALSSNTLTQTVAVTPVDNASVAQNGSASGNEDSAITGSAVATDVDSPSLTYSLVGSEGGAQHGTVTFTNAATGAYTYTPAANFNGTDTFTFKANDGSLDSNTATITITVGPVNDAPDLTPTTPAAVSYTENASPTPLLATGAVTDVDNPANFAGGGFTVAIASPATGDEIVLLTGTPFAVSGSSLLYGGNVIGTIGGVGTATVSVTNLTSSATPTVVNALSEAFGYESSSHDPSTTDRTVHFTFNDGGNTGSGGALDSNIVSQTVHVAAVNDAPVNTVPTGLLSVATGGTLAIAGLAVSDVDGEAGTETTTLSVAHGTLNVDNTVVGGAAVTNNASASVTLTGTVAAIDATLAASNSVVYTPTAAYAGPDTLTVLTDDGGNTGGGAKQDTDTVAIAVGSPILLDLDANNSSGATGANYTALAASFATPIAIADADTTIVDAANPGLTTTTTATVTITTGFVPGEDVLAFTSNGSTGNITAAAAFDNINGVLTLKTTAGATPAQWEAALHAVTYQDTLGTPTSTADRIITVVVNDGTGTSNTASATVHLDAAPVAQSGTATGFEDSPITGQAVATDADTAAAQLSYSLVGANGGAVDGTVTINADGSFTYTPTANFNGTDSFSFTANDGTLGSNTGTISVTVNPVNDAPVLAPASPPAASYTSGGTAAALLATGAVTDVDSPGNFAGGGLTVTITNAASGDQIVLLGSSPFTSSGTTLDYNGVPIGTINGLGTSSVSVTNLNTTADPTAVNALTEAFAYQSSSANPATTDRTVAFTFNDGGNTGAGGALSSNTLDQIVHVTAVNATPSLDLDTTDATATGTGYAASYTVSGPAAPIAGTHVGIIDANDTNMQSATVTLTNALTNDTLSVSGALPSGISAATTSSAGTITLTLTGSASLAAYEAALDQVVFANSMASPDPTASNDPRLITVVVDDQAGFTDPSNTATSTITVVQDTAPVANPKTASATEAGGLNNGTAGVNPTGNVITDATADHDAEDPTSALMVTAVNSSAAAVGTALGGTYGTLTLNANGSYTYLVDNTNAAVQALLNAGQTLTDTFNYTIKDTAGLTASSTLTVTIHGANDNPVAVADTTLAEEAGGVNNGTAGINPTGNVLTNDTDVDSGDSKTVQGAAAGVVAGPITGSLGGPGVTGAHGTLTLNSDGTYTYVVNNNDAAVQALRTSAQTLTDTFSYTMHDAAGATSTTELTVTIEGQNDAPTAVADTASATEAGGTNNGTPGSNATGNVLTNDTDPDSVANGETQTVQGIEAGSHLNDVVTTGVASAITGAHGTLTLNANGSFSYAVNNSDSTVQALNVGQSTTDTFTYTMHDAAGATSTSTLTVTINGADDAPVAVNQGSAASPAYTVFDGVGTAIAAASGLKTGASDVDNTVASLTAVKDTNPTHGTVTINSDGSFTYNATAGYFGADSFTYHVTDPGNLNSNSATAFANVQPLVWHIDNSHTGDPTQDGSAAHPFQSIAAFNTANAAAGTHPEIVYLSYGTGTYTEANGIHLNNNQSLVGQGSALTYQTSASSPGGVQTITLIAADPAHTPTIVATGGDGVDLAQNNTLTGFKVGNASGNAISDEGGTVGTLNVSNVAINTSGEAVHIANGGTLNVDLSSVASSGGSAGIALGSTTGTFHVHGGALSGASGAEVALNSGSVNFTEDGTLSNSTGTNVSISSMTGGAQSFTGAISGHGIALSNDTGATISFSGGVAINTSASNTTGFSATGGGTLTVTGSSNTINSGQGTALDVEHTTISASNLTFQSISSSGGSATGIILDTTGASGGLHVTGVGTTAGSGGTIATKTGSDGATASGNGIYLNSTSGVQLADMHLHDFQNYGISGTNVSGFTADHLVVDGSNGTSVSGIGEGDVYFTGLSGSASVTNSTFTGAVYDAFHVFNDSGQTLNRITMTGDTFATQGGVGNSSNSALVFEATGGTFNATVQSSTFNGARNDLFHLNLLGTVSSDLVFGGATAGLGNTLTNSNQNIVSGEAGIDVGGGGPTNNITLTYNISHNSISGVHGTDISVFKGTGTNASFTGTIDSNTIGTKGTAGSGSTQGAGIAVFQDGAGTSSTTITNNHISGVAAGAGAIDLLNHNGGGGDMTAVIQGNTIDTLDQTNAFSGIYLQTGSSGSTDNNKSDYTIGGAGALANKIDIGSNSASAIVAGIILDEEGNTKIGLLGSPNYSGGAFDTNAVQNYVAGNNTVTSNGSATLGGGATSVFAVTNPGLGYFGGAQFLLAASGGVQASSPTPGETNLTQAELDSVVAAAIADWAAAGASASQLAALHATTFSVANLGGNILSEETTPAHITVDASAAGHGWYIDPTPSDNSEFTNALNAAGTDLLTDTSNAAAGHMDLLTAVTHELGHVLGLADTTAAADVNDLMYINLVDGERKLPGTVDVAQANADTATYPSLAQASEGALPVSAQAPAGTPIVVGTAGNDTIDAGHGGNILFGGAGADHFVFGPGIQLNAPTAAAAQPITHVADYSAAQGDTFDFSALTSAFHASNVADASLVRAVEDPSGTFATLQLNTNADAAGAVSRAAAQPSAVANWANVAQIDGAHAGDAVNVLVDSHAAIHLAQIHATLLV